MIIVCLFVGTVMSDMLALRRRHGHMNMRIGVTRRRRKRISMTATMMRCDWL